MSNNYFVLLSGWIANLGVVPLFRLAAFRLLPIFFFLFFLIILVCFVFETIKTLFKKNKSVLYPMIGIVLHFGQILSPTNVFSQPNDNLQLLMGKGEQKELYSPHLKKFSIGNKDVVSVKYDEQKQSFFIKGKALGLTDLIIWQKKAKKKYTIFVISKKEQLEQAQWLELFKNSSLRATLEGNQLTVRGEINSEADWHLMEKLSSKTDQENYFDVTVNPRLKKVILKNIYQKFFRIGLRSYRCEIESPPHIICYSWDGDESQEQLQQKTTSLFIKWIKATHSSHQENFQLSLKIISVEAANEEISRLGVDSLMGSLAELFSPGPWVMLKRNSLLLKNINVQFSVLAEPQILLYPEKEAEFSIGSEIAFEHKTKEESTTEWKFAGLQLKAKLIPKGEGLYLEYQTNLSRPEGNSIEGNVQKSVIYINSNEEKMLFRIGLQTTSQTQESLPFWKNLPLLKKLFSSEEKNNQYKHVVGIIKLIPMNSF